MRELSNFWLWLNENLSERAAFENAINNNYRDMTTRAVYADYLQERDLASEDSLEFLRFSKRPPMFVNLPNGKVWIGYHYTTDEIMDIVRGSGSDYFHPRTMRMFKSRLSDQSFNGPGGTYFITSERVSERHPRDYAVRKFIVYHQENRHFIKTIDRYPSLKAAQRVAQQLASTPE